MWSCYLYFVPDSEGTLFSKWNETPLDNALCFYTPSAGSKLPGYITKNGGKRTEIVRQISASRIQEYYRGYCEFIKESLKYDSVVTNCDSDGGAGIVTLLAYLTHDDCVLFPKNEEEVKVKDYVAVAVMNSKNNVLAGIQKTTKGQFVDKVRQNRGYAIRFDR